MYIVSLMVIHKQDYLKSCYLNENFIIVIDMNSNLSAVNVIRISQGNPRRTDLWKTLLCKLRANFHVPIYQVGRCFKLVSIQFNLSPNFRTAVASIVSLAAVLCLVKQRAQNGCEGHYWPPYALEDDGDSISAVKKRKGSTSRLKNFSISLCSL